MIELEVLSPGLFTTVQDGGRHGLAHLGIPASGPMDPIGCQLANAVVGNALDAAALELTALGGRYRIRGGSCVICIGGAIDARLDGVVLAPWIAHRLPAGAELTLGQVRIGLRAYLAVAGSLATPLALGSRATLSRASLGGWQGRALVKGDRLPLGESEDIGRRHSDRARLAALYGAGPLAVVEGPQQQAFTPLARQTFFHSRYRISAQADRMGYRLAGAPLSHRHSADMVSDAVVPGSIQVPGNGQPIIAMHDRQTTGGYPKIATVIGADLPRLGQLRPGQSLAFRAITPQQGVARWRQWQADFTACVHHIYSTETHWL